MFYSCTNHKTNNKGQATLRKLRLFGGQNHSRTLTRQMYGYSTQTIPSLRASLLLVVALVQRLSRPTSTFLFLNHSTWQLATDRTANKLKAKAASLSVSLVLYLQLLQLAKVAANICQKQEAPQSSNGYKNEEGKPEEEKEHKVMTSCNNNNNAATDHFNFGQELRPD